MLRLLHKNVSKKVYAWGQLLLFSAFLHLGVLCTLFVLYRGQSTELVFTVNRRLLANEIPVIVLGTIPKTKKMVAQKKVAPKVLEKSKPKPRTVVQKIKIPEPINKSVQKKELPRLVQKTVEKKVVQTESVRKEHIPDGPIIVAKNYKEKALIKQYQVLQKELASVWHPPVGVDDDKQCLVHVIVACDGSIRGIDVTETSGVLMFDVAARSALCNADLPRWTWGKSLDITFS